MKRLFTFGCSYSDYFWPTWAEMLSTDFDYFENWGQGGLGNRAIAERLAECCSLNDIGPDDTVIVQWSTHLRHDWYHVHDQPDNRPAGWKTFGSMFSQYNANVFTKQWCDMFFFEQAYIMHTLNSIRLAQGLLESTGCKWYMTSIGDVRNLGSDINANAQYGESRQFNDLNTNEFAMSQLVPNFKFYETSIWDKHADHWLEPMHLLCNKHQDDYWWFSGGSSQPWKDTHPSPAQHLLWLEEVLQEKMPISNTALEECAKMVESIGQLKTPTCQLFDLVDQLKDSNNFYCPENVQWPSKKHGL